MPYQFDSLDPDVRKAMIAELSNDIDNGRLNPPESLNSAGQEAWANLLWEAAESHNDGWLAAQLRRHGYVQGADQARKPEKGKKPEDPATNLAEVEFNRLYVRGVCADALAKGKSDVEVYRGLTVADPVPDSQSKVGKKFPARKLLNSLRNSAMIESVLGLAEGRNSGLTVKR